MSFSTAVFPFKDHFRYAVYVKDRAGMRVFEDGRVDFDDQAALKHFKKIARKGELCCGVGAENTFVSFLDVPFDEAGVLDRVVRFEAEPFIPLEPDDVFTGYTPDVTQLDQDSRRVLAVCVEKTGIADVQEKLRTVGLWPSFEPEILALVGGLMFRDGIRDDFAVFCVRGSYSFWCLVRQGKVFDVGFYHCGAEKMLEENFDFSAQGSVCQLLKERFEQVFENCTDKIFVLGQESKKFLSCSGEFKAGKYFCQPESKSDFETLLLEGLALKGFGQSPVKFDFVEKTADFIFVALRKFMLTACLICVLLAVFAVGQFRALRDLRQQTAGVENSINTLFYNTFGDQARMVDPVGQLQVYLENRGTGGQGTVDAGILPEIFKAVDKVATETGSIKVERFSLLDDGLHIEGTCADLNTPERFAEGLLSCGRFADVRLESVESGAECVFKVFAQL